MTIPAYLRPDDLNRVLEEIERSADEHDNDPDSKIANGDDLIRVVSAVEAASDAVCEVLRIDGFITPLDDRLRVLETVVFWYLSQSNPDMKLYPLDLPSAPENSEGT